MTHFALDLRGHSKTLSHFPHCSNRHCKKTYQTSTLNSVDRYLKKPHEAPQNRPNELVTNLSLQDMINKQRMNCVVLSVHSFFTVAWRSLQGLNRNQSALFFLTFFTKLAFVDTPRRSSRGNAWPARLGNRKMHSRQNMQGHKPHFIVFVRRANRHMCVVCARRARTKRNFLPGRGNEHARAVECVWIVRVKPGAGGDAASARCSKQRPLLNHGWRSIVRVMVTKSAATAGNAPFPAGASAKRCNGSQQRKRK